MSLKSPSRYSILNPQSLLHFAPSRAPREITLADGTQVGRGELVAQAHFWNEHLPRSQGAEIATGLAKLRGSLHQLARSVQEKPDLSEVRAIYGEVGFLPEARLPQFRRILEGLGFELIPGERPGWNPCRRAFWRNAVSWWYLRTFNMAASQRTHLRQVRRCEAWISREQLLARYGH
jgi:hypothetical protein